MADRPAVTAQGIVVDGRTAPLLSAEVQFWRMEPKAVRPAVRRLVEERIPFVASYLSWRRHEPHRGAIDLTGSSDPRLDVRAFLDICADEGVLVHLKPGPWICAEEVGGGYPDWLLQSTELLALDSDDRPVRGYNPPFVHPVPSYLDPTYLDNARTWIHAVGAHLRDLTHPAGPVTLVQLDNEPSYCFRDSMYGADYHPAVLTAFTAWALETYDSLAAVRGAWAQRLAAVRDIAPPRAATDPATAYGRTDGVRQWHRDWARFKEWLLGEHLRRLRTFYEEAGLADVVFTVNTNRHKVATTPQDPGTILAATAGGVGGEDHYYEPPLTVADLIPVIRAAAMARGRGDTLAFAPEIQAGIWRAPGEPVDYPNPTAAEQALYYTTAIAAGYRGLNFYMATDRENWALAPIASDGSPTKTLDAVRAGVAALRATLATDSRPRSRIVLISDQDAARDAYAGLEGAGTEYATLLECFDTLVRAGHLPVICFTDAGESDVESADGVVMLSSSPTGPGLGASLDDRQARALVGGDALKPGELVDALAAAGVQPFARSHDPNTLVIVHDADAEPILFVLSCGAAMHIDLSFTDVTSGALVPLADAPPIDINTGSAHVPRDPAYRILRVQATRET